jgi:hypothetical protein
MRGSVMNLSSQKRPMVQIGGQVACKRTSVIVSVAAPVEVQPGEKPVFEVSLTAIALVVPGADARLARRVGCLLVTAGTALCWASRGRDGLCCLVTDLLCFYS